MSNELNVANVNFDLNIAEVKGKGQATVDPICKQAVSMLASGVPKIPHTLSSAAPTKAAEIRSAVTGALVRESNGLLCFERTVETTFLLPWDLNPKVGHIEAM